MKKKYFELFAAVLLVVLLVLSRKLPLAPNVSLLGSAFLLAGYLTRQWKSSIFVPFLALFVSDYFIGFYSGMAWVYGAFTLSALVGSFINKVQFGKILGGSFAASLLFYLITNFGVWMGGGMYPQNLAGLGQCYLAALPFFRNSLTGDLIAAIGVFYAYLGIQKLAAQPQSSSTTRANLQ